MNKLLGSLLAAALCAGCLGQPQPQPEVRAQAMEGVCPAEFDTCDNGTPGDDSSGGDVGGGGGGGGGGPVGGGPPEPSCQERFATEAACIACYNTYERGVAACAHDPHPIDCIAALTPKLWTCYCTATAGMCMKGWCPVSS